MPDFSERHIITITKKKCNNDTCVFLHNFQKWLNIDDNFFGDS